jgi:YVTN family beta-propeller protein
MNRMVAWLLVSGLGCVLAACGGGGGGGSSSSTTTTTSTTTVIPVVPSGTIPASSSSLSVTGFKYPQGLAVSADGKTLYVADANSNSVIEIALDQANYPEHTLALVTSPGGASYTLSSPTGLAVDSASNTLYIANFATPGTISAVDLSNGVTSTLGLPALNNPTGLSLSPDGSSLYVASHGGGAVLQVPVSGGAAVSYAPGTNALLPWDVYLAPSGSQLYVTDTLNNVLGSLSVSAGTLQTGSYATAATGFNQPLGVVQIGSYLYVANYRGQTISKVDPATGAVVKTIDVAPNQPFFLATDGTNLYFTDGNDGSVNEIKAP